MPQIGEDAHTAPALRDWLRLRRARTGLDSSRGLTWNGAEGLVVVRLSNGTGDGTSNLRTRPCSHLPLAVACVRVFRIGTVLVWALEAWLHVVSCRFW